MTSLATLCVRAGVSKEMQHPTTDLEGQLLQPHQLMEIRFPLKLGKDPKITSHFSTPCSLLILCYLRNLCEISNANKSGSVLNELHRVTVRKSRLEKMTYEAVWLKLLIVT